MRIKSESARKNSSLISFTPFCTELQFSFSFLALVDLRCTFAKNPRFLIFLLIFSTFLIVIPPYICSESTKQFLSLQTVSINTFYMFLVVLYRLFADFLGIETAFNFEIRSMYLQLFLQTLY